MPEREKIDATVLSSTVIRVPGAAHATGAPFILILVETDQQRKLLGHFDGLHPPPIGSRVNGKGRANGTIVFTRT